MTTQNHNLSFSNEFISIGCNKIANCSDVIEEEGLFAYCGNKFVVIYELIEQRKVVITLKGHTSRVNCVRFLKNSPYDLISSSVNGEVIFWSRIPNQQSKYLWKPIILTQEGESVTNISILQNPLNLQSIFVSFVTISGKIKILEVSKPNIQVENTFEFTFENKKQPKKSTIMETCDLFFIPGISSFFFLCGGCDEKIHIFSHTADGKFDWEHQNITLKGHRNWIKHMDHYNFRKNPNNVWIATAGLDDSVRLWKFVLESTSNQSNLQKQNIVENAEGDVEIIEEGDDEEAKAELTLEQEAVFLEKGKEIGEISFDGKKKGKVHIFLDSILTGHSDWVHSVHFSAPKEEDIAKIANSEDEEYSVKIVTSSMDRTIMIWEYSKMTNIWHNETTLGAFGGLSGLFGQLGMYNAFLCSLPNPTDNTKFEKRIIAHSFHGAFHEWTWNEESHDWQPIVSISGHFDEVNDVTFDPHQGEYCVSVSKDQTSRIWAQWNKETTQTPHFHEIGRPQIHGYDLNSLSFLNNHCFVSGSDEKVLRVFKKPKVFVQSKEKITGNPEKLKILPSGAFDDEIASFGATVPALGLSNKPIASETNFGVEPTVVEELRGMEFNEPDTLTVFTGKLLERPPYEEELLQNTLWPEMEKLYGHSNDIFVVRANNSKKVIVSGTKAKTKIEAVMRVWDVEAGFKEIQTISTHNKTITDISFTIDDEFMCSVSRDRNIFVYKASSADAQKKFEKICFKKNAHERIIWGCDWCKNDENQDRRMLITVSRSGSICIWKLLQKADQYGLKLLQEITLPVGVTTVSWFPVDKFKTLCSSPSECPDILKHMFIVGCENGEISIFGLLEGNKWSKITDIDPNFSHCDAVRRAVFGYNSFKQKWYLASCSTDFSVRIFEMKI